jgi:hypothetical protein
MRLGNRVIFIASSCSHSRVFSGRKHNGLQITKPVPHRYETGYRILLSLLAGIAISANLQSRYNDPKAAVALDLPLEPFKHIADEL